MTDNGDKNGLHGSKGDRPDSLERLLSHCAARYPLKTALTDPPNRNQLEGRSDSMPVRSYDFKSLDETVTRVALRFGTLGLQPGDYVMLQMANLVETPLLVLALMRARLIPCLIPLSWSLDDISRSFDRLKPKALVSCGQIEGVNYSENMREVAFSHQHIRFVLGAGYDIADGITNINSLFDPQLHDSDDQLRPSTPDLSLNDLSLVTYIDPVTPVPHNNGQILATGLLHVLSLGLSSKDDILSAYPLSSIPGLTAHFYPWLMSGCSLSLHHPFQFDVLLQQLQSTDFSYFAAPDRVISWILQSRLNVPKKLAIVRREHPDPLDEFDAPSKSQLFDLWNLAGVGSVPVKYRDHQADPLFLDGRICLPSGTNSDLCLAGAKICHDRLYIKGRIFPAKSFLKTSLEWVALNKRFDEDWLDTGLAAFPGPDNSILLGQEPPVDRQKIAS